jgi:tyrosinase
VRAEVGKPATGSIKIERNAFSGALESNSKAAVVLTLSEVEIPEKRDFFVRIFLDKRDVGTQTPMDDPHYAGSFAFFSDEAAMKKHQTANAAGGRPKAGFLVNITPTLRKLSQAGSLTGEALDVTLVPMAYEHREAGGQQVTLGKLDLKLASF